MRLFVNMGALAGEAGILASIVAGIAAWQGPDRGTWIEHNPLLFGGGVALAVFMLGLLILILTDR